MIEVKDVESTGFYKISTRLLMQEALRKGYSITYFPSSPSTQSGVTRCVKDGNELFFRSTCAAITPSYGVFAAENKVLTYSLLSGGNVNTPEIVSLKLGDSTDDAEHMLARFKTVVVKPVDTNHGDGITVGVKTKQELEAAIAFARKAGIKGNDADIIVQQQVEGDEYRFLVVEGKVIAVASRKPPCVTGDGTSTIGQLIEEKNKDPRRGEGHRSELTRIDFEDVTHHRGEEFLNLVPGAGEEVQVLDTSNLSRGGEAIDFTAVASPALKKMAVRAAQCTFLGVAGVDIMTKDITSSETNDSYVIEVNLTPGIRMHQFPSQGKPINVAKTIFAAIEKTARPVGKEIKHIGRSETVTLPGLSDKSIPARIDTGATISAIWASQISESDKGLSFVLFDKSSEHYSGQTISFSDYSKRAVSSSMGHTQMRYQVKMLVVLGGRRIKASFTLADRSSQVYPILVGRNILRNKFIVDVAKGKSDILKEKRKRSELNSLLDRESEII